MAIAASLKIVNQTGSNIMFTYVNQVNDDSTWSAPSPNDILENNQSVTIAMGNASFFPQGCGCSLGFVCQGNFKQGSIYFDDPAVGAHTLTMAGSAFSFSEAGSDPGGSSYVVTISLA